MEKRHLNELDGMRGILALFVMFYHYGLNGFVARIFGDGPLASTKWDLCVDFFFILSGFVISLSLSRNKNTITKYFISRFLRLWPVHICILIIYMPFFIDNEDFSFLEVFLNAVLLQSNFGFSSINFPSWSASLELTIPALMVFFWRRALRLEATGLLTLMLVSLLASMTFSFYVAEGVRHDIGRATSGLALGFTLFLFARRGLISVEPTGDKWRTYFVFAGVFGIMALSGWSAVFALLFPPICCLAVIFGARSTTVLSSPLGQWLGARSYTIYMVHVPVISIFVIILGEAMFSGNVVSKLIAIGTSIFLADVLTRFVELPVLRMRNRLLQRRF